MSDVPDPKPAESPTLPAGDDAVAVPPSTGETPPLNPTEIAFLLLATTIIGCFFAPWSGSLSASALRQIDSVGTVLWLIPVLALATLLALRNLPLRQRLGTTTAISAWVGVFFFFFKAVLITGAALSWGASLTLLASMGLFVLSGERRYILPMDLVAKRLNSRKAEVYSHWGTVTPGIHFSTQEFYKELEAAIQTKQWPGVEILRVDYTEAGLLSHTRQYFRVIRQRHLFDVCAATFGTDYFFTLREAEIPCVTTLRDVVAVMLGLMVIALTFIQMMGFLFGMFAFVFLFILGIWFLFNVLKMGLSKVDAALVKIPVLGVVYDRYFRSDTYFQQDSRTVFLQCISELVKQQVDATTAAKGLKLLRCFERAPLMDGLYKRSWRRPGQTGEPPDA